MTAISRIAAPAAASAPGALERWWPVFELALRVFAAAVFAALAILLFRLWKVERERARTPFPPPPPSRRVGFPADRAGGGGGRR